jgi:2-amino-4-hydroxy-6-hydroxymethyldihydropteridine diphosphokinase
VSEQCGVINKKSFIYETAAWGMKDQGSFLNQALMINTPMSPEDLLKTILDIEQQLGRIRDKKFGPRIIDIDILLYNDVILNLKNLTIPHPQLIHRRFALQCLADIAPDKLHPVYKKTIHTLLEECSDDLRVDKFK